MKVDVWCDKLKDYHDQEVVELLKYGFPIGYSSQSPPVSVIKNHNGAYEYPQCISDYLSEEVKSGLILGPWKDNHLSEPLAISPMNSVPKKLEGERRIIADFSFPEGSSVNGGISKDDYLGREVNLSYPTVDNLAKLLKEFGPGTHMFKKDLKKAYRQFLVDPSDIHLCGYYWNDCIYVDVALVMGCRSAAHICQRVTNSVAYMADQENICTINYLDDLCAVADPVSSHDKFQKLTKLLQDLGLRESVEKSVVPDTRVEFLGIMFDSVSQTMEVTAERLQEISELLDIWSGKKRASKRELQSLLGKLVFISKCVYSSRVFISRMLATLRSLKKQNHRFKIGQQFKKDLAWWRSFLKVFNGVSFIPEMIWSKPDEEMSTDACLSGGGGWSGCEYFSCQFPEFIIRKNFHINALELWVILVGLRLWHANFRSRRIQLFCDNQVSVGLINSGKGRDPILLKILREILFLCSTNGIQIRAVHLPGLENRRADKLSRAPSDDSINVKECVPDHWVEKKVSEFEFRLEENW